MHAMHDASTAAQMDYHPMDAAMLASQQAGPSGSGMPVVALLDESSQPGKSDPPVAVTRVSVYQHSDIEEVELPPAYKDRMDIAS
jgi:hypothetical protein